MDLHVERDHDELDELVSREPSATAHRKPAEGSLCCTKAYLRALYWGGGYLTSPRRGFQFEMVLPRDWPIEAVHPKLEELGLSLSHTRRREREVIYTRTAETIISLVGVLGASNTLLLLQDVSITKELKNGVNRLVNCEVSNLRRSSHRSMEDLRAIRFLKRQSCYDALPDTIRAVAEARTRHPSMSLTELGQSLCPPLSKSTVYNRLRRLRIEADSERTRAR